MKLSKLSYVLIFSFFSIYSFAGNNLQPNDIIQKMNYGGIKGVISSNNDIKGLVDSDKGIVKSEIVFSKNGFKYTIWHIAWKDKNEELRVFFKNEEESDSNVGFFSFDGVSNVLLSYSKGAKTYKKKSLDSSTINVTIADNLVQDHIANINKFLESWLSLTN